MSLISKQDREIAVAALQKYVAEMEQLVVGSNPTLPT